MKKKKKNCNRASGKPTNSKKKVTDGKRNKLQMVANPRILKKKKKTIQTKTQYTEIRNQRTTQVPNTNRC